MKRSILRLVGALGAMAAAAALTSCKAQVAPQQPQARPQAVKGTTPRAALTRSNRATSMPVSSQAANKLPANKLVRVVFVGKQKPCDCTRKRLDAGWAALQEALGAPTKVALQRLHSDTEEAKVAPYRAQRPMVTLPAIYFVDSKATVLELLQGDITAAQIKGVLARL